MTLYTAAYNWPNGERSRVTFASEPRDALRWAGDYVRAFVQGELLAIAEVTPRRPDFQLRG